MRLVPSDWLWAATLGLFAYFASVLSTEWAGLTNDIAVIWPANGALLGALLRVPLSRWAPYLAAFYLSQIAANLALDEGPLLAAAYPFGDFAGTVAGALVLARLLGLPMPLANLREALLLVVVGAGIGQAAGGVFGALVAHVAFGSDFLSTWLTWSVSGAVGIAFVTPAILAFEQILAFRSLPRRRLAELLVIEALVITVTAWAANQTSVSLLYMVSPVLLWAALRFQIAGAAVSNAVAAIAVIESALDHIVGSIPADDMGSVTFVLLSQSYLLALFLPSLVAAALFEQFTSQGRALAETEAKFRDFAEATSDWQWEMDDQLRFTAVSESFERITGFPPERIIGKDRSTLARYPDSEVFRAHLEDMKARRPFRRFRYAYMTQEAMPRVAEISGKPVYDAEGAFKGYRGTGSDVTDQFEAEQRFRVTFESANVGIVLSDASGMIVDVNRKACEFLGYERDELVGRNIADFIAPQEQAQTRQNFARMARGQTRMVTFERRYRRKDGVVVWGLVSASAVPGPQEEAPLQVIGVIQDITLQKHHEQALRESEARYRRAARLARIGHWVWNEIEGRCEYCSPELAELLGVTVETYFERSTSLESYFKWVHPDDRESYAGIVTDAIARKSGYQTVVRLLLDDGRIRYHHELSEPILDSQGRLVRSVGVSADITEARETEEALRQSQKLEAIGKLTGGVAHDMNNILGIVLGNLEFLRGSVSGSDLVDLVDRAVNAADRGARLTHRLLAFARQQPLAPGVLNAGELLRGMSDLLRRTIGEDVELEVVVDAGLWPCKVDSNQLENVILNLSVNARDALPEGGKLTIEASNARLDQQYADHHGELEPGQYVCLAVTDTGSGMDAKVLERAFDPFFTTKAPGQGTGLGLSMAHGFAKQSGGHITIYSEPNEGTTVRLYLPRSRADEEPVSPARSSEPPDGKGEVVLVVEDDAQLRAVIVQQLAHLGYRTLEAEEGIAALEVLRAAPGVDLLLSDVILPGGLNGMQLAHAGRNIRPDLHVLFMSGYTENAVIHQGRLDDGVELIQKPFRQTELAIRLRKILED